MQSLKERKEKAFKWEKKKFEKKKKEDRSNERV